MTKLFFEVFPTLHVKGNLLTLFENVEVPKVTTNRGRTHLKIHIFATHLIQKKQIRQMEQAIKDQLFGMTQIDIRIVEKYQLSGQYTPENLLNEYRESILYELSEHSIIERNMFQNAAYAFRDGNILMLQLENSIVAKGKQDAIIELLRQIYEERFGMPLQIEVSYTETDMNKHKKLNEIQLQQEVNAIVEKNAALRKEHREEQKEEQK